MLREQPYQEWNLLISRSITVNLTDDYNAVRNAEEIWSKFIKVYKTLYARDPALKTPSFLAALRQFIRINVVDGKITDPKNPDNKVCDSYQECQEQILEAYKNNKKNLRQQQQQQQQQQTTGVQGGQAKGAQPPPPANMWWSMF
jgi:hypothetical protein